MDRTFKAALLGVGGLAGIIMGCWIYHLKTNYRGIATLSPFIGQKVSLGVTTDTLGVITGVMKEPQSGWVVIQQSGGQVVWVSPEFIQWIRE